MIKTNIVNKLVETVCVSDLFVGESSYAARLVFEAGLSPLLHVSHVPQVPDEHAPARRPHDQPVSGHRQRVDLKHRRRSEPLLHQSRCVRASAHLLRLREGPGVAGCSGVPEPHRHVPAARHHHVDLGTVLHAADGSVVRPHDGV